MRTIKSILKGLREMEDKLITELRGLIDDINVNEIAAQITNGTLLNWIRNWKMKSHMVAGFIDYHLSKQKNKDDNF